MSKDEQSSPTPSHGLPFDPAHLLGLHSMASAGLPFPHLAHLPSPYSLLTPPPAFPGLFGGLGAIPHPFHAAALSHSLAAASYYGLPKHLTDLARPSSPSSSPSRKGSRSSRSPASTSSSSHRHSVSRSPSSPCTSSPHTAPSVSSYLPSWSLNGSLYPFGHALSTSEQKQTSPPPQPTPASTRRSKKSSHSKSESRASNKDMSKIPQAHQHPTLSPLLSIPSSTFPVPLVDSKASRPGNSEGFPFDPHSLVTPYHMSPELAYLSQSLFLHRPDLGLPPPFVAAAAAAAAANSSSAASSSSLSLTANVATTASSRDEPTRLVSSSASSKAAAASTLSSLPSLSASASASVLNLSGDRPEDMSKKDYKSHEKSEESSRSDSHKHSSSATASNQVHQHRSKDVARQKEVLEERLLVDLSQPPHFMDDDKKKQLAQQIRKRMGAQDGVGSVFSRHDLKPSDWGDAGPEELVVKKAENKVRSGELKDWYGAGKSQNSEEHNNLEKPSSRDSQKKETHRQHTEEEEQDRSIGLESIAEHIEESQSSINQSDVSKSGDPHFDSDMVNEEMETTGSESGRSSPESCKRAADGSTDEGSPNKKRCLQLDERELTIPLEHGWNRQTVINGMGRRGIVGEVHYFAPCGKKMKTIPDVMRYLERNPNADLGRENFSFNTKVNVGQFFEAQSGHGQTALVPLTDTEVLEKIEMSQGKKARMQLLARRKREQAAREQELARQIMENKLKKQMELQEMSRRAAEMKRLEQQAQKELERAERENKVLEKRKEKEQFKIMKQQEKMRIQEQLRKERELRAQQIIEARNRRQKELEEMRLADAVQRNKEREMKRQQLMMLKEQERERRRQHLLLVKALEQRKRQEERLHQRQVELEVAMELKKPVEDMELKNAKPLPKYPRLKSRLAGQPIADSLMVVEFLNNFGLALNLDKSSIPTLETLERGLLSDCEEDVEDLMSLVMHLLRIAIDDVGVPNPKEAMTKLNQKITEMEMTDSTMSEFLRIFIKARGEKDMSEWLSDKPMEALNPTKQAAILAFLCNELLASKVVANEIDKHMEAINNLRRDKWLVEGQLRQLRLFQARKFNKIHKSTDRRNLSTSSSTSQLNQGDEDTMSSAKMESDEDDDKDEEDDKEDEEDSGNESDGSSSVTTSASTTSNTPFEPVDENMTREESDKRIEKLRKQHLAYRQKVFRASLRLRAINVGQDRYKRTYWILPLTGGVYVEGMESGVPEDYKQQKEVKTTQNGAEDSEDVKKGEENEAVEDDKEHGTDGGDTESRQSESESEKTLEEINISGIKTEKVTEDGQMVCLKSSKEVMPEGKGSHSSDCEQTPVSSGVCLPHSWNMKPVLHKLFQNSGDSEMISSHNISTRSVNAGESNASDVSQFEDSVCDDDDDDEEEEEDGAEEDEEDSENEAGKVDIVDKVRAKQNLLPGVNDRLHVTSCNGQQLPDHRDDTAETNDLFSRKLSGNSVVEDVTANRLNSCVASSDDRLHAKMAGDSCVTGGTRKEVADITCLDQSSWNISCDNRLSPGRSNHAKEVSDPIHQKYEHLVKANFPDSKPKVSQEKFGQRHGIQDIIDSLFYASKRDSTSHSDYERSHSPIDTLSPAVANGNIHLKKLHSASPDSLFKKHSPLAKGLSADSNGDNIKNLERKLFDSSNSGDSDILRIPQINSRGVPGHDSRDQKPEEKVEKTSTKIMATSLGVLDGKTSLLSPSLVFSALAMAPQSSAAKQLSPLVAGSEPLSLVADLTPKSKHKHSPLDLSKVLGSTPKPAHSKNPQPLPPFHPSAQASPLFDLTPPAAHSGHKANKTSSSSSSSSSQPHPILTPSPTTHLPQSPFIPGLPHHPYGPCSASETLSSLASIICPPPAHQHPMVTSASTPSLLQTPSFSHSPAATSKVVSPFTSADAQHRAESSFSSSELLQHAASQVLRSAESKNQTTAAHPGPSLSTHLLSTVTTSVTTTTATTTTLSKMTSDDLVTPYTSPQLNPVNKGSKPAVGGEVVDHSLWFSVLPRMPCDEFSLTKPTPVLYSQSIPSSPSTSSSPSVSVVNSTSSVSSLISKESLLTSLRLLTQPVSLSSSPSCSTPGLDLMGEFKVPQPPDSTPYSDPWELLRAAQGEAQPIPTSKQHGWWRIYDLAMLRSIMSCTLSRGIREKNLQRAIHRYLDYAQNHCTFDSEKGEADPHKETSDTEEKDESSKLDEAEKQQEKNEVKVETIEVKEEKTEVKDEVTEIKVGTTEIKVGTTEIKVGTTEINVGTTEVKVGTAEVKVGTAEVKVGTTEIKGETTIVRDETEHAVESEQAKETEIKEKEITDINEIKSEDQVKSEAQVKQENINNNDDVKEEGNRAENKGEETEEIDYIQPDQPGQWSVKTMYEIEMAALEEVEALEERIFQASLQAKQGWRPPKDNSLTLVDRTKTEVLDNESYPLDMGISRLLELEANIERRYLKPPLIRSVQLNLANLSTSSDRSDADFTEDEHIPPGLLLWRQAVVGSESPAQLSLCTQLLAKSISWEKSIMRVTCQLCRKDDNEAELLLCDGCDKGYHTYCFKPKMDNIPDGDWYCYECVSKVSGTPHCVVCGQPGAKMASCQMCPRYIHLDCLEPPLPRMPKRWQCLNCIMEKNNTKKSKKRKEKLPTVQRITVTKLVIKEESQEDCDYTSDTAETTPAWPSFSSVPPGDIHLETADSKSNGRTGEDKSPSSEEGTAQPDSERKRRKRKETDAPIAPSPKKKEKLAKKDKKVKEKKADEPEQPKEAAVDEKKTDKGISKDLSSCGKLLTELEKHEDGWPFLKPVNKKQFPSYKKYIKTPMDFSTARNRIKCREYKHRQEFATDMRLIFNNCETFNEDDSEVGKAGYTMRQFFERRWLELFPDDAE